MRFIAFLIDRAFAGQNRLVVRLASICCAAAVVAFVFFPVAQTAARMLA